MKFKQLNFKKQYRQALQSGIKTTTVRVNTELKPGDLVELVAGGVSCGYARIKEVVKKKVAELDDKDAKRDGFKSRRELIRALKRHYNHITSETYVYIISFKKKSEDKR